MKQLEPFAIRVERIAIRVERIATLVGRIATLVEHIAIGEHMRLGEHIEPMGHRIVSLGNHPKGHHHTIKVEWIHTCGMKVLLYTGEP